MRIWIDQSNSARLITALADFGFGGLDITENDLLNADTVIQLGYAPKRIDIITSADGVDFNSCWTRRTHIPLDGLSVPFISIADLIVNKQASGRPQDLADVAALHDALEPEP